MSERHIDITVPMLARVEGEGALDLQVLDGEIETLNLRIYEPPRLFEKFVEGREYHELPDMVARICGICPVAYQMSAVQALESAMQVTPPDWVRALRRVMYCGEWIQSHALHIHLLAAPDFFGFASAPEMAEVYPGEVRRGLKLQGLGNELIALFGGRSVHPVGVKVGGFHRAPQKQDIEPLLDKLRAALPEAEALVRWAATIKLPNHPQSFISVSLRHPTDYPIEGGRIVSSNGLDIPIDDYEHHFKEFQVPHSTALHSLLDGEPYLLGPLARLNLNFGQLPQTVQQLVAECGITFPSNNMFHSLFARAVEIYYCFQEAVRILTDYHPTTSTSSELAVTAGSGVGCTEAPRGLLWHRYELDQQGVIRQARIVPPTSQNQARIEADLRTSLQQLGLHRPDDELRLRSEMVIRNYDPCISCATHFLQVKVVRR